MGTRPNVAFALILVAVGCSGNGESDDGADADADSDGDSPDFYLDVPPSDLPGPCEVGARVCHEHVAYSCKAVTSGEGGTRWFRAAICPLGCELGACVGACPPGSRHCVGKLAQTCSPERTWVDETCTDGCAQGTCSACSPGEARCDGDAPDVCSETGTWIEDMSPCPFGCGEETCTNECDPVSQNCDDGTGCSLRCDDTPLGVFACGAETGAGSPGDLCFAHTSCAPGSLCISDVPGLQIPVCVQLCRADDECPADRICTERGPICWARERHRIHFCSLCSVGERRDDGSICGNDGQWHLPCEPGDLRCQGSDGPRWTETCGDDGQWRPDEMCAYSCVDGACSGHCVPGEITCSDDVTEERCSDVGEPVPTTCEAICIDGIGCHEACGGIEELCCPDPLPRCEQGLNCRCVGPDAFNCGNICIAS